MARSYANIDVGIWDDPDFCTLTAGAQRTYFMLITQTDITACGSLALTLRRWAKSCSEKDLDVWLAELSDARFVLIDEDTEELLVRTFVKWDGGYKHAKRVMAVLAYAKAIRSVPLRSAVLTELGKLGVLIPTGHRIDCQSVGNEEAIGSGRSVVKQGEYQSTPHSTLQEREPFAANRDAPSMFCNKHPNGTEKPCGPCGTAKMRYARHVKESAGREAEARRLVVEARRACERCDPDGWALDTAGTATSQRCDHRRAS